MVAILAAVLFTTPVHSASSMQETASDSETMSKEQISQDLKEMRQSIRMMIAEMAKNKLLLQEMTREMLKEASRNKELLKVVIRGIAQNKEAIRAVMKDIIADKELLKALHEDRKLIQELLDELSRTDVPDKANDEGKR